MLEYRIDPQPGQEMCDFCAHPHVVKVFAAHVFDWKKNDPIVHRSDGGWAACAECARLIGAERWDAVLDRAVHRFIRKHRIAREDMAWVREELREIHGLFREHRIMDV